MAVVEERAGPREQVEDARRARAGRLFERHAVDVVVAALTLGWLAYALRISDEFFFWSDDLRLIDQAGSVGDWFEPYNDHMSVTILAIYRAMAELAGLSYAPYLLVGLLCLVSVPVLYYLTARRTLGPVVAALLALPLLWHADTTLRAASLNHYLALAGGIVCAAALNRGRRADGVLAAGLVFALAAAGGGLVVAGACLLHNLLVRPHLRRWVAVLLPIAAWGVWWVVVAESESLDDPNPLSVGETIRFVGRLYFESFVDASLGNRVAGAVLVAAHLAYGASRLRRGLVASANFVTWTTAIALWGTALGRSRGPFADAETFRYRYLALGFALLAVVPRQRVAWPARLRLDDRRWVPVLAAAVLLVGLGRAAAVRDDYQSTAHEHAERGREALATLHAVQLGPDIVPDDRPITFYGSNNPHGTAGEVRTIVDRYGGPDPVPADELDGVLVDERAVRAIFQGWRDLDSCSLLREPFTNPGAVLPGLGVRPPASPGGTVEPAPPLRLWAPERVTIEVRRFGDEWVAVGDMPARRVVHLRLPQLDTNVPWQVRADGACIVPG